MKEYVVTYINLAGHETRAIHHAHNLATAILSFQAAHGDAYQAIVSVKAYTS